MKNSFFSFCSKKKIVSLIKKLKKNNIHYEKQILNNGRVKLKLKSWDGSYAEIDKRGFWYQENKNWYQYEIAKDLCNNIIDFFKKYNAVTIVDMGCGNGSYSEALYKEGFDILAIDGNPNIKNWLNVPCMVADLSKPLNIDKFDWVLCLEVGEHIPKKWEKIFINNLHNSNSHGIILSWAIEGQGGFGHFNCRNNEYIKKIFKKLGYQNLVEEENKLRKTNTTWFQNTIMVFKKNNAVENF